MFIRLEKIDSQSWRLKYIRSVLRLSRSYLTAKYGISSSTLKYWENSAEELPESAINKCIEMYRNEGVIFSREWIMYGTGLAPKLITEIGNIFSNSASIELARSGEVNDETLLLQEVKFFRELYEDGTVMVVPNNDMLPYYKAGDYVCGRQIFTSNLFVKAVSNDCIIQLTNGSKYFRRLIQDHNGFYNLLCLNALETVHEPVLYKVEIESVAPVIWHRRIIE
jgi:hypothetical protein